MKNLKLIALFVGCCLISTAAFSQSFSSFGTYTTSSESGDDKVVLMELNANGTAYLEINGVAQAITHYTYDPSYSDVIKFKGLPSANTISESLSTPAFRSGLLEPLGNGKWMLQLNDFGQGPPAQFNSDAITLDFDPN